MTEQVTEKLEKLNVEDTPVTEVSAAATTESATTTEVDSEAQEDHDDLSFFSSEECSLYIGDIPPNVTEAHLFDLFSKYGTIKSIKIPKDTVTRRSHGYAFVNFNDSESAKAALADTEPVTLLDRTLRVLPFQKFPALHHNSGCNVFIKNLDPSIDSVALGETFSAFGKVVSCKIAHDPLGFPRGFGYVLFETPGEALRAIETMDGVQMNDRVVSVTHHIPKRERLNRLEQIRTNYTNLYIKNIAPEVTEEEFKQLFEKHGEIISMSLPLDNEGQSRGFGFVNFAAHEMALAAVEELNGLSYHERRLYVSRAQKKSERIEELRNQQETQRHAKYPGTNLYIKNLDVSIDDEELKSLFASYGEITSARVMTNDHDQSRGFGFVCFSTPEQAQRAIAEMNRSEIKGQAILVKVAQRKDTRHMMNELNARIPFGFVPSPHLAVAAAATAAANAKFSPHHLGSPQFSSGGRNGGGRNGGLRQGQQFNGPVPTFVHPAMYYRMQQAGYMPHQQMAAQAAVVGPKIARPNSAGSGQGSPQQLQNGKWPANNNNSANATNSSNNSQHNYHQHGNGRSNGRGGMKNSNQRANNGSKNQQAPFGSSLSAVVASAASPEAAKQDIGEALYPKVFNHPAVKGDRELAGKITGMLLEQPIENLLQWADDEPTLKRHIQHAYDAYLDYLKQHGSSS